MYLMLAVSVEVHGRMEPGDIDNEPSSMGPPYSYYSQTEGFGRANSWVYENWA